MIFGKSNVVTLCLSLLCASGGAAFGAEASQEQPRSWSIVDFGAKDDGTKATAAFAAAIAAAHEAGGGRVDVPVGTWVTGAIHLKSNVELHLDDRARVVFTDDLADYLPPVRTSFACLECWNYSPLLHGCGCTNVAVTGGGTFAPKMDLWRSWFNRNTPEMFAAMGTLYGWGESDEPLENRRLTEVPGAKFRPCCIEFNFCRNVRLRGFRVRESPCWTVHLRLCEDVHVDGLDIHACGPNNDGIDIDSSKRVLIENCRLVQGDDGFVIKSGRDRDGRRVGVPTEDVEIRNCTLGAGLTLLAVGSEVSGGIRNVCLHDCRTEGTVTTLLMVKTSDRKGAYIENVVVSNVVAEGVSSVVASLRAGKKGVDYQWGEYPARERIVTRIDGFRVENVRCENVGRIYDITGDERLPARNVTLRDNAVGEVHGGASEVTNVVGFVAENVRVEPDPLAREKLRTYRATYSEGLKELPRQTGLVWRSFAAADTNGILTALADAQRHGRKVVLNLRAKPGEWRTRASWLHYRYAELSMAIYAFDIGDGPWTDQYRTMAAIRATDSEMPILASTPDLPYKIYNVIYRKSLCADGAEAIAAFQRRHACRICVTDAAESALPSEYGWDTLSERPAAGGLCL